MSRTPLVLLAGLLFLAACTPREQQQVSDAVMDEQEQMMEEHPSDEENMEPLQPQAPIEARVQAPVGKTVQADAQKMERGQYVTFSDDVLADGRTKVLFFHAGWCPACKQADTELRSWYGAEAFPLTVYKVDYDSRDDLKSRYGVTYQHTFVKVDGRGNVIESVQGPSDDKLREMLKA